MHRASNCFRPSVLCLSTGALSPPPPPLSLSFPLPPSLVALFLCSFTLATTSSHRSVSFSFRLFLRSFSPSLHLVSTVLFWIDGRRRPCFFSRPETPTHPLVACENAIRWDGGNGISLLTRDCCRRRPPCFLLLLRFCRSPRLASPRLLFVLSFRPLSADPYDGIHPSFLRPRINTTVRWKTAQPESHDRSIPSVSRFSFPCFFSF